MTRLATRHTRLTELLGKDLSQDALEEGAGRVDQETAEEVSDRVTTGVHPGGGLKVRGPHWPGDIEKGLWRKQNIFWGGF